MRTKQLNYKDLQDGLIVQAFIPAVNKFFKLCVTERKEDSEGGFNISNKNMDKDRLIEVQEYESIVRNQQDMDSEFYMQTGVITDESYDAAKEFAKKNGKRWIS